MIETVASRHDGPVGEKLANPAYILVQDRAYGKIERFDRYKAEGQSFVIRLQNNVQLRSPQALSHQEAGESPIMKEITCFLGTASCRSVQRHRVIGFQDGYGHDIRLVTDLMTISAEQVADMYKIRWQIALFFRWIKPHLNGPT